MTTYTDEQFRLCYVDGAFAWFTTAPLTEQWGDDWDDAPYELNAGEPYEAWLERDMNPDGTPKWHLRKIAFEACLDSPCYMGDYCSVEQINAGEVPWLRDVWNGTGVEIPAGTTLPEFRRIIRSIGGKIYVEEVA